jgi:integrase
VRAAFETVKGNPLLNAAAHLGLNCAMGPKDLGTLPEALVDLDGAQIVFARGKTGVGRLCPLLPETVQALRDYLTFRAKFKSVTPAAAGLFFRTRQGMPYARNFGGTGQDAGHKDNLLGRRWNEAVKLPFSGLRSTFATHADDWHDQRAVDVVMGHKVGKVGRHIRRHYAKRFPSERARRLVEHVWRLAFGGASEATPSPAPGGSAPPAVPDPGRGPGDSPATGRTPPG